MKAFYNLPRTSPFIRLLLLGCTLELLYALLCPIFPFQIAYPVSSQTSMLWIVIMASGQSLLSNISVPATQFNHTGLDPLLLALVLMAIAAIYLISVAYAFHAGKHVDVTSRWLLLPLIGAFIFSITLQVFPLLFNQDVQNTIDTGISLLLHLINCLLVWMILSRLASTRRLGGTILYAWNPLILIEVVANEHSYGLLLFVLLLTTVCIIQDKGWWYELGAMIFLGSATGSSLISLMVAPMFIYYCAIRISRSQTSLKPRSHEDQDQGITFTLNTPKNWSNHYSRLLWEFAWRTAVVSLTAAIVYVVLWPQDSFYASITSSFNMQYLMHSPLSIMVLPVQWLNSHIFPFLYPSNTTPSHYLQAIPAANMAVQASALFIFFLLYIYLFGKVRGVDSLLASSCLAILGFIILLAVQFWPWYSIWMLWIVALRRFDALSTGILLLSCIALLTYPLLYVDNGPLSMYQPLLIFGIPLIYLITQLAKSQERMMLFDDRRSETAKN